MCGLALTHLEANDVVFTCCHCGEICRLIHQGDSACQMAHNLRLEVFLPVVECHIGRCDDNGVAITRGGLLPIGGGPSENWCRLSG
jgi:hypothetical protein